MGLHITWLFPLATLALALACHVCNADVGDPQNGDANLKVRSCEAIRFDLCLDVGYNNTGMPNLVGHESQQDATMQLETFRALIQYGCSDELKFFLCSVYFPLCTEKVLEPIGPCRPMCERVRSRCQPVLEDFGFPWPPALNCSKFHETNDHVHMCMPGPGSNKDKDHGIEPTNGNGGPYSQDPASPAVANNKPVGSCQHLVNPERYVYINRTERCALLCGQHDLFTSEDKHFADIWIAIWATLCFVSTIFTGVTFFIDAQRFRYPERPIILLSLCFTLSSIAYIIRLIAGREGIACDEDPQSGSRILIQEGLENTNCAIVFLLLYYFSTASCIWWVILSLTWYLAAGLKWGHEAIQRHSTCYHIVAWAIPAIQTIIVLVMRVVDADELTGMCFVGNQNDTALLGFVIIPLLVYLVLGVSFLLAGIVSLFRIRNHVRNDGVKTGKLELLMVRIGIFSVLYTVPATCVLACYFYQYVNRRSWYVSNPHGANSRPSIEIFMLKVFMSLVVGITSGMWIWSSKTISSWQKFCSRMCAGRRRSNRYGAPGTDVTQRWITAEQKQSQNFPVQQSQYQYRPANLKLAPRDTQGGVRTIPLVGELDHSGQFLRGTGRLKGGETIL